MKTTRLFLAAMLTSFLTIGCATRVQVIPADKTVIRLDQAKPFTPSIPGYFVPDARMKDILDRLAEKEVFGK